MGTLAAHPWLIVAIPGAMALAGLGTSRMAIWALFRPLSFVGVGPVGWQGYVPARAAKIATPVMEQILARIGTVRDVYRAMDPDRIAEHIVMSLQTRMSEVVEDTVLDVDARLWDELPDAVKRDVVDSIERDLPELVTKLVADIDTDLEELVDVDHLVSVWLVEDKPMLNRLLAKVGRGAFTFLSNVGLVSGLITGIVMVLAYVVVPQAWVLPLVGLVVMLAAGQLTLNVVFGAPRSRRIGPWRVQGVLYLDQDRGSRAGVRIFTREILTVGRFVRETVNGPRAGRVHALIAEHAQPVIHRALEVAKPVLRESRTDGEIATIEEALLGAAIGVALEPLDDPTFNRERQVVLEDVFLNRMLDLTPTEYEALVRPAVRDAEWLYVTVSGLAGLVNGALIAWLVTLVA